MDAETLGSLAALIAALTGLINVLQGCIAFYQVRRESLKNREISNSNNAAIAAVDVKVGAVAEQTNGHMTNLIAKVANVDPGLAIATAVKLEVDKALVADKLKALEPKKDPP